MRRDNSLIGKISQLHWFLLLTICAIAAFGMAVLISAASSAHDLQTGKAEIHAEYAFNHGARFALMLCVALVIALVPLRLWAGLAFPSYVVGVILLVLVDVAGVVVNGAERWLQLGPIRLQPSELMKLALPLALARYYHQMFDRGRDDIWELR
jgi:rod shape determining protein RodA